MRPTRRQRDMLGRKLDELEARIAGRRLAQEPFDHPWDREPMEKRLERTAKILETMVDGLGYESANELLRRHGFRLFEAGPGEFAVEKVGLPHNRTAPRVRARACEGA